MPRHPDEHHPLIVCDPARQFGRPTIAGTRITAANIASSHWAGDSVEQLVDWYEIDRLDVLWCCAWWVHNGHLVEVKARGPRRKQWQEWADHALSVLGGWEGPDAQLCDPDDYGITAAGGPLGVVPPNPDVRIGPFLDQLKEDTAEGGQG